ncbi:hypothetical protein BC936DRAFT_139568 [Jimgerdemannia flammicorona]|uniref:Eukaryotic peptide chain release factor GTP-binding subunit n=1 Tax=Jimgerdemannia flammicorona TaxID=994334 RepID=A0A433B9M6_9FUNG|nr:hypothetical protein BC936DRAFT_139568 [Jimgerdemannia flammicorona]
MNNNKDSWEDESANDLPNQAAKLTLNPNASEWKPNFGAKEFVPSWLNQGPAAPAPAPIVTPIPVQPAQAKVLKLSSDAPKPPSPAPEKKSEAAASAPKKADSKPGSRPETPAGKKKDVATSSPAPGEETSTDQGYVNAEISAVDEEILTDLYGKEHLNVVFMGHVDAGKSTMGGNILFLTGMVDKRTMEKYEKEAKEVGRESWYLSWALDTNSEERAKGKTVETGRAYFETDKRRYTILDAPGHKNFVPSMISGASQADIGVLVISARKGEFETGFERGGQTREHAMLAKTTGVNKLIVAVNKMDDPTVQWDKARYDEIISKINPFLKITGFNPKTDITFIPVSGYTGANIKDRAGKAILPWFDGPSLLEQLDNMQILDRKIDAPLMIPITEKYKDMGTIVVGKIESGKIKKGKNVILMPNRKLCEITALYNETEDEVPHAVCGDNVRIRLRGVEEEEVSPGFVLCEVKDPVKTTTVFEAQLAIIEHKSILCAGYTAVLHVHAGVEEITIAALLHSIDKKTGRRTKRAPQFVKQGQKVICRIEAAGPICVERFEDHPQLGRFTLRDEGKTIAIGKITKIIPPEGESRE